MIPVFKFARLLITPESYKILDEKPHCFQLVCSPHGSARSFNHHCCGSQGCSLAAVCTETWWPTPRVLARALSEATLGKSPMSDVKRNRTTTNFPSIIPKMQQPSSNITHSLRVKTMSGESWGERLVADGATPMHLTGAFALCKGAWA